MVRPLEPVDPRLHSLRQETPQRERPATGDVPIRPNRSLRRLRSKANWDHRDRGVWRLGCFWVGVRTWYPWSAARTAARSLTQASLLARAGKMQALLLSPVDRIGGDGKDWSPWMQRSWIQFGLVHAAWCFKLNWFWWSTRKSRIVGMIGFLKCYSYMQLGYAIGYLSDYGHIPEISGPPFCLVRPLQQSYITMGGHKKAGQNIWSIEWCLSGAATELMQSTNNAVEKGQWINGLSRCIKRGFGFKVSGTAYPKKTNQSQLHHRFQVATRRRWFQVALSSVWPDWLARDDYAVSQSV